MSTSTSDTPRPPCTRRSRARLSTLDRFLPVWIGLAMVAGLLLGRLVPGLDTALSAVEVDGVSLPIALGLLVMMYPVLAKVRYDRLDSVTGDRRLLVGSLLLNWVVGPGADVRPGVDLPARPAGLPHRPDHRRAWPAASPWSSSGTTSPAATARPPPSWSPSTRSSRSSPSPASAGSTSRVLPGWLGLSQTGIDASTWDIARSVLIFLGVPLLAGFLSRRLGEKAKGRDLVRGPRSSRGSGRGRSTGCCSRSSSSSPSRGRPITSSPLDVARIALPLLVYFAVMWGGGFALGAGIGPGLRAHHDAGLHRRRQQLRARHRRRHRHLRRRLGPGARRRRRPAHRGARPGRPRLRQPRAAAPLRPRPAGRAPSS